MANPYLVVVIGVLALHYLLELVVERLNLRRAGTKIPEEFKGYYDA
jgi:hypothetical protein